MQLKLAITILSTFTLSLPTGRPRETQAPTPTRSDGDDVFDVSNDLSELKEMWKDIKAEWKLSGLSNGKSKEWWEEQSDRFWCEHGSTKKNCQELNVGVATDTRTDTRSDTRNDTTRTDTRTGTRTVGDDVVEGGRDHPDSRDSTLQNEQAEGGEIDDVWFTAGTNNEDTELRAESIARFENDVAEDGDEFVRFVDDEPVRNGNPRNVLRISRVASDEDFNDEDDIEDHDEGRDVLRMSSAVGDELDFNEDDDEDRDDGIDMLNVSQVDDDQDDETGVRHMLNFSEVDDEKDDESDADKGYDEGIDVLNLFNHASSSEMNFSDESDESQVNNRRNVAVSSERRVQLDDEDSPIDERGFRILLDTEDFI